MMGKNTVLTTMTYLLIVCMSIQGCVVEDEPAAQGSGSSGTNTKATAIGKAQVTFFNGLNTQLNKPIEIYLDDPSDDNAEKLVKAGLSPLISSTISVDVYEDFQNEFTFYFKDATRPSGLFRGTASGAFNLEKDGKYTIVLYGASLDKAVLLDNEIDGAVSGFSYVRGINLASYGLRIKKSIASGDTDVNLTVGPFSDQRNFGDYKGFTRVLEGTHVVQAIDYINVATAAGGLKKDFGSKAFASRKAHTIVIITSSDLSTLEFVQINH
ncbi:MAG: hypothetical protein RLN86_11460 [Cyclobacteriaceae bacterium]